MAAQPSRRLGSVTRETESPKSKRSRRSISLDPGTVAALRAWRKVQAAEQLAAGEAWARTGHVFTDEVGEPLHNDLLSSRFRSAVTRSGVERIRLHDLRHTHATISLQAGVPVKIVSERLGHASVAFTLDVYGHVMPGDDESAALTFAAAIDAS